MRKREVVLCALMAPIAGTVQAQMSVSLVSSDVARITATGLQSGNGRLDCAMSKTTRYCIGIATRGATVEVRAADVQRGWAVGGFTVTPRGTSMGLPVCGKTPVCRFTVTQAVDVTLNVYRSPWYAVTVTPSANGSVTINAGDASTVCSIAQPSGCSPAYGSGTIVKLVPTPTAPATFVGFSGACTGTGDCTLTLGGNKAVSVAFTPNVTLALKANGSGHLEASLGTGGSRACTGAVPTCSASFMKGSRVSIAAVAGYGARFSAFSRGCRSSTSPCTITLTSDTAVQADFVQIAPLYGMHLESPSAGWLEARWGDNNAIACGPSSPQTTQHCDTTLLAGTSVTVTATPGGDDQFARWKSGCATSGNPCTVSLAGATTIAAEFESRPTVKLTFQSTQGSLVYQSGSSYVECDFSAAAPPSCASPTFRRGQSVTLNVQAAYARFFAGWTGACSGTALTCTLVMDADKTVGLSWK